jgi:hypothetical protein
MVNGHEPRRGALAKSAFTPAAGRGKKSHTTTPWGSAEMNNSIIVFLVRAAAGFLGGLALTYFFFTPKGRPVQWFIVVVLACLVVAAAYISEAWRQRKEKK